MRKTFFFVELIFFGWGVCVAHEGHKGLSQDSIIPLIGNVHLILLHFPIALIIMTLVSEICAWHWKDSLFDHAARFMLFSAAILSIPTVLMGLALSYGVHYEGELKTAFFWHSFLGMVTAFLTILAVLLREGYSSKKIRSYKPYFICLVTVVISVNLTAFFGGIITFGLEPFIQFFSLFS